ncbi:GNAT family N-acetyltransferase [Plantactinospora sp. WMMC1484]|uniref:GNAT family N-acetyltransferase n=1 Tax=Plantactinospora sp. WMMC1484 TaxID=3404122 RepID=UPI003BF5B3E8
MTDTGSPSSPPVEVGTAADWDGIAALLNTAFHSFPDDPAVAEATRAVSEPHRSLLVRSGEAVVAHAAAFTRELTVPGAVVPAAHVTRVAVAATHRRQGLLSRLMRRQLRDILAAGDEPVAVLWASEGPIYPRFGYGQASQRLQLDVRTAELRLVEPDGTGQAPPGTGPAGAPPITLRTGDPVALQPVLAALWDRLRPERPGWSSRPDPWWRFVLAEGGTARSGGATPRLAVLAETADGPVGYALWHSRADWDERGPRAAVTLDELVAADPAAYATLWRFLLNIDLTRHLSYPLAAVDEPLQHLVDEPRQLGAVLAPGLWIRVVDLPAALAARKYAADVDVVLEVSDPLLPENAGRWRLTVAGGTARCRRTDDPVELACDIRDLGAAYLGGPSLAALGMAGRVRELHPDALARTSAAFGWHRAPVGLAIF